MSDTLYVLAASYVDDALAAIKARDTARATTTVSMEQRAADIRSVDAPASRG